MSAKKETEAETPVENEATIEKEPTPETKPVKAEKKFSIDNLAKNSYKLFGVSSCTFTGATAGLEGEYSINEMNSIIKSWCGKEIM